MLTLVLLNFLLTIVSRLLIGFANSFDPDQAQESAEPDLDPMYLTLLWYF